MAEVAVVGAGPVGSVVAATLAAAGRSVAICEIATPVREAIAAGGVHEVVPLHAMSQRVMARLATFGARAQRV